MNDLIILDQAIHLLAKLTNASEAKKLADMASAAEHYAKRHKLGDQAIGYAHEINIRALSALGRFLEDGPKTKGSDRGGRRSKLDGTRSLPSNSPSTLKELGLEKWESSMAQLLARIEKEHPKEFEQIVKRLMTLAKVKRLLYGSRRRKTMPGDIVPGTYKILHCSMDEFFDQATGRIDAVITDPPYPKKFLPLYGKLAERCRKIPLVAVMCGHSYLPEILAAMTPFLKYRWILAYLTPGGQAAQQFHAKINTFWKPVLLFGEAAEWIGDVIRSDPNDNDKVHHPWGQSESGMADLVNKLTQPGQVVCDPFLGGGTTAYVALKLGRRFVGCDLDPRCVQKTLKRLESPSISNP